MYAKFKVLKRFKNPLSNSLITYFYILYKTLYSYYLSTKQYERERNYLHHSLKYTYVFLCSQKRKNCCRMA